MPFHYAGIVKEFPTAPKDSFFVANADYIAQRHRPRRGRRVPGRHRRQRTSAASPQRCGEQLGTAATVTDLTQTRAQVGSSLTSVDLAGLTRLELAFAVLLAAAAGGLVLALGLAERRRTLAIRRCSAPAAGSCAGMVLTEAVAGHRRRTRRRGPDRLGAVADAGQGPDRSLRSAALSIAVPAGYLGITVLAVLAAITTAAVASARTSTRPPVEELRDL